MEPYYADDLVTLFLGDCREVADWLSADVLVTDPPYGVNLGVAKDTRAGQHGLAKKSYDVYEDTYDNFVRVICPVIEHSLAMTTRGAVFSGPHLQELPKASAVGGIYCPSGSGRHSWGFKTFLPVLFYGTAPALNKGARPNVLQSTAVAEKNGHPCPKPLPWMRWLVDLASMPGEVVLDPFAGSGTTLLAAKELGRKAVGVEISERYAEKAAQRLSQGVLDLAGAVS
jgi:DNA modification methylase